MAQTKMRVWDPVLKRYVYQSVEPMKNDIAARTVNMTQKVVKDTKTNTAPRSAEAQAEMQRSARQRYANNRKNTMQKNNPLQNVGVVKMPGASQNAGTQSGTGNQEITALHNPTLESMKKVAEKGEEYNRNKVLAELGTKGFFSSNFYGGTRGPIVSAYRYNFATDDELKQYTDLSGGQQKAYIESLNDALDKRMTERMTTNIGGIENKAGKNVATTTLGYIAGYDEAMRGAEQVARGIFGDEKAVKSSVGIEANKAIAPTLEGGAKLANNIAYAGGQMTPAIVTGVATGGAGIAPFAANAIGAGVTGVTSGGSSYAQAIEEGHTPEAARAYGITSGLLEGGLSLALKFIPGMSDGGVVSKTVSKALAKAPGVANKIGTIAAKAGDEAAEEYVQSVLNDVLKNATLGENKQINLADPEYLYSALLGAIMGGTFNATEAVKPQNMQKEAIGQGQLQLAADAAGMETNRPKTPADIPGITGIIGEEKAAGILQTGNTDTQKTLSGAYNPDGMYAQGNKLTAEGFNSGNTNMVSDASETRAEMRSGNADAGPIQQGTSNSVLDRSATFAEDLQQKNGVVVSKKTNPVVERLAAAIRDMQQNKGGAAIPIKTNPVVERMAAAIRALQQNNKVADSNNANPVVEQLVHALQNTQNGKAGMGAGNATIERIANAVSQMAGNQKTSVQGVEELTGQGIIKGSNAIPDVNATEGAGDKVSTDDSAFNDKEERSISEKTVLLDDYIKSNKIESLPLSSDEILSFTDGRLKLAKNVVKATKEVIPGKSVSELVDIFKLPNDPASSSLSTYQTRIWYRWQESLIGGSLDYSKPLKQVARDAFDMRNEIRTKARASMSDRELAELLMKKERNLTFSELVKRNMDKGLTGDELWRKIIKSSMSSRDYINKLFQIE